MADEITFSDLDTNGGRISEVLSGLVLEQLYDPTDLRAVMTRVPWQNGASDTMQLTLDAVPGAASAASSETSGGASNSAYDTSEVTFTVARYLRKYQVSDLFGITGVSPDARIDIQHVADKLSQSVGLTMTDLLCGLFDSLSTTAVDYTGTSNAPLDVAGMEAAAFALMQANVQGPYTAVLYPVQVTDFKDDLAGITSGAYQFHDATTEMAAARGPGFQGTWQNIEIWSSDSVEAINTNAESAGAMFGDGCFGYTMAPVRLRDHLDPDDLLIETDELVVERDRDADNGLTSLILNFYPAVVEIEDARGVEIQSDR